MNLNNKQKTIDYINIVLSSFNTEQKLNEDNIYLICRGTKNKQNLIAKNFNITNKEITHIGIGIYENESLKIFNVSVDKKINNKSLIVETFKDFINIIDIFHIEVWAINESNENKIKLKSILNKYMEKNIAFDYSFNLNDNENYYCSEFVAKILNELNSFQYNTNKKEVNRILKKITKADEFEYFPVDFFLQNPNIIQIYKKNNSK